MAFYVTILLMVVISEKGGGNMIRDSMGQMFIARIRREETTLTMDALKKATGWWIMDSPVTLSSGFGSQGMNGYDKGLIWCRNTVPDVWDTVCAAPEFKGWSQELVSGRVEDAQYPVTVDVLVKPGVRAMVSFLSGPIPAATP